jgi:hypothetical protein
MGFMSNLPDQGCQPDDNADSDGAMGLGIHAQNSQCACGAGNTAWFVDANRYTGCKYCDDAWLWVRL